MKRGSLVGPLLLIAIGALFLARNIFPDLPLLDFLSRYWPYLLIVWGGLRLAEVLMWASAGKPLPVYGVSGGEWMLVIFLCMVGLSINAARGITSWLPRANLTMGGLDFFGESFDYNLSAEKPTSKTPRIVVQAFRGDARIVGADVDSVKVTGHHTVRSMDKGDADRANTSAPLELSGDANQVTIRTNQDRVSGARTISSVLEITVPRGASLELHGRRGDFDVSGINGTVDVDSENAGVRLENIAGAVRVDVRNSDILRATNLRSTMDIKGRGSDIELENIEGQVNVNGSFSGISQLRNVAKAVHYQSPFTDLTAEKVPGTLRVTIGDVSGSNITGPLRLSTTRSKDVQLTDVTNAIDINLSGGDIQLSPGAGVTPKIDARTRRGDIELSLAGNAKFDLTAVTERGEAENDFGSPITQSDSGRKGQTLRGANGGPAISLETKQGSVRVRKGAALDSRDRKDLPKLPAEAPEPPQAPKAPLRPLNQ
jgi:DUF4097 and DUF4098 domain-containing protein YvlB